VGFLSRYGIIADPYLDFLGMAKRGGQQHFVANVKAVKGAANQAAAQR
jgi:hypothetical protein